MFIIRVDPSNLIRPRLRTLRAWSDEGEIWFVPHAEPFVADEELSGL